MYLSHLRVEDQFLCLNHTHMPIRFLGTLKHRFSSWLEIRNMRHMNRRISSMLVRQLYHHLWEYSLIYIQCKWIHYRIRYIQQLNKPCSFQFMIRNNLFNKLYTFRNSWYRKSYSLYKTRICSIFHELNWNQKDKMNKFYMNHKLLEWHCKFVH